VRIRLREDLKRLQSIPSVSGDEALFGEELMAMFREAGAERVEMDLCGNVFAWKGDPRRAVVGHMDTVGFMVEALEGDHCVLQPVGGTSPATLQRGILVRRDGQHELGLISSDKGGVHPVFEPLDGEAVKRIQIGDRVSYYPHLDFAGDYLQAPYLDNRLGCWMALEAVRRCESVLALCTTSEETTGSGAKQARRAMEGIESLLVVDVTYGEAHREPNRVKLGQGPVVCLMDQCLPSRAATEAVRRAGEASGVALQFEVTASGGSDVCAFLGWDRPVLSCFFGVASRHNHQPLEVAHLGDVEQAATLLAAWCNLGPVDSNPLPKALHKKTSTKAAKRRRKT
jgi:endoglucanase